MKGNTILERFTRKLAVVFPFVINILPTQVLNFGAAACFET